MMRRSSFISLFILLIAFVALSISFYILVFTLTTTVDLKSLIVRTPFIVILLILIVNNLTLLRLNCIRLRLSYTRDLKKRTESLKKRADLNSTVAPQFSDDARLKGLPIKPLGTENHYLTDSYFEIRLLIISLLVSLIISMFARQSGFWGEILPNIVDKRPEPSLNYNQRSKISKAFDELPKGVFVFACPKNMTVGISEKCTARIASDKYLSAFEKCLREGIGEKSEFGEIKLQYISSIMNVKLTGEQFLFWKAFDIKPEEDGGNQLVIDKDFTSWEWNVTPQESGIKRLKFIVSVIIQVDGYQNLPPKRYEENEVEIAVKVNPIFSLANFVRVNWKYLAIMIVIGLVSIFMARRLKIVGTTIEVGSIGDINVKNNQGAINLLGTSRDISIEKNQDARDFPRSPDVHELIEKRTDSLIQIKGLLEKLRQFIEFNPILSEKQKVCAFEEIKFLIQVCAEQKPDAHSKAHAEIAKLEEVIKSGSSVEAGLELINEVVVVLDKIL